LAQLLDDPSKEEQTVRVWNLKFKRLQSLYPLIVRPEFRDAKQVAEFLFSEDGQKAVQQTLKDMPVEEGIDPPNLSVLNKYFGHFCVSWNSINFELVDPSYPCTKFPCPNQVHQAALGKQIMEQLIQEKKWSHSFDFIVGVTCPVF